MQRIPYRFPEVRWIDLSRHEDERGAFWETWRDAWREDLGIAASFVQDNVSVSRRGVLRGLHYQRPCPQAKLVTVLTGSVFDVVVDIRRASPRFGQWSDAILLGETPSALFVPRGFAHGFLVLSAEAVVAYKVDAPYAPEAEHTLAWDDPDLQIAWPVPAGGMPVLSPRDQRARRLRDLPLFP